jgi:hypothetical protein
MAFAVTLSPDATDAEEESSPRVVEKAIEPFPIAFDKA